MAFPCFMMQILCSSKTSRADSVCHPRQKQAVPGAQAPCLLSSCAAPSALILRDVISDGYGCLLLSEVHQVRHILTRQVIIRNLPLHQQWRVSRSLSDLRNLKQRRQDHSRAPGGREQSGQCRVYFVTSNPSLSLQLSSMPGLKIIWLFVLSIPA